MKEQEKPKTPYKSMTSDVSEGSLRLFLQASDPEETIRFAYALHTSLLPVKHTIIVSKGEDLCASFQVVDPRSYGK